MGYRCVPCEMEVRNEKRNLLIDPAIAHYGLRLYKQAEVKELSDLRPMIKVGEFLYLDAGKEVTIDLNTAENVGKVHSSMLQHEKPTEEGPDKFRFHWFNVCSVWRISLY